MRYVAIALATAVALVVFVAVLGSVVADVNVLNSTAGWYGLAIFAAFPIALGFFAWRDQR